MYIYIYTCICIHVYIYIYDCIRTYIYILYIKFKSFYGKQARILDGLSTCSLWIE